MGMKLNSAVFFLLIIALLGGLFLLFKPHGKTQMIQHETKTTTQTTTPMMKKEKVFELVVKNKKLVSGKSVLQAEQDEDVVIKITVDEDEELHLHGYDKSVDLEKNKEGTLSFKANLTGRFPFELEHSKTDLGALEVQPK